MPQRSSTEQNRSMQSRLRTHQTLSSPSSRTNRQNRRARIIELSTDSEDTSIRPRSRLNQTTTDNAVTTTTFQGGPIRFASGQTQKLFALRSPVATISGLAPQTRVAPGLSGGSSSGQRGVAALANMLPVPRAGPLGHTVLSFVACYQISLWVISAIAYLCRHKAEEGGGELFSFVAGIMGDVVENRAVFAVGMLWAKAFL